LLFNCTGELCSSRDDRVYSLVAVNRFELELA